MSLNEISERLGKVSDIYAEKFGIRRDDDWFVLKMKIFKMKLLMLLQ